MTSGNDRSRVHVVIPARYGSTRLPAKPLIELAGVPMIVRVYRRVRAALDALDADTNVIVAIDDERIAAVLDAYNVPALLTDPEHRSGTDRSAEVAERLGWHADDLIVNVQGDEPLLPSALLTAFIAFCNDDPQLRMATVAALVTDAAHLHDPNIVKLVVNAAGDAALFSRSPIPFCRDVPTGQWPLPAFLRHIGIYAYRRSVIGTLAQEPMCELEQREKLEQLRAIWLGIPIKVMTWPEAPPHGVDTWDDVKRVSDFLIASNGACS
jgi:3-deoxy-manno-octulosonate cytidylyltransferase (CMP-KDO synthetase)